ncbi:MAG: chromosome segregation protein SMC [Clostridia bacterium]|nr:chromosome segregation protein SMC [Clostridia bacterium]
MFLKGLALQGFKSFADKAELHFGPGISVIVGPNGSGKSNIADGIRWVLGEQSIKSLRGAKMEDIIFSGSAKRRSVGMAEVSLTLDNTSGYFQSQYSEITITRRLFRSGESEFFINKRPCRLKDVHELFMDTGLGKEAFSIIGQGRVEEILNSKSEERRFLVEEAAGIIKYKNRKKEAVKKITETEQHLQRINDLIFELGEQLGPLEEQAKEAITYKKLKVELDELEIAVLAGEVSKLNRVIGEISSNLEILFEEKLNLETKIAQGNNIFQEMKLKFTHWTDNYNQAKQHLFELRSTIEKLEAKVNHNNQLLEEYLLQERSMASEVNNLITKIGDINDGINRLINDKELLKKQEHLAKNNLDKILSRFEKNKEDLNKMLHSQEELNNILFNIASDRAKQKNIFNYSENEIIKLKNDFDKKTVELTELRMHMNKLEQMQDELSVKLQYWNDEIEDMKNKKDQQENSKQQSIIHESELQNKMKELELGQEQAHSRLTTLKEMQNSFEGYQSGVKAILSKWQVNPDRLPGIMGSVGELIDVEEKYLIAIETSLGSSLQYIVTKSQQAAKLAINFLKESKAGRCTFLPVESVRAYPKVHLGEVANWAKVYGVASELIKCDNHYQDIIGYLLNRTIIVEDIDTAILIAKKFNYKIKAVTLAGEVISPGGALTGGAHKYKQVGFLNRAKEITNLEKGLDEGRIIIQRITDELQKAHLKTISVEKTLVETIDLIQKKKLAKVELDKDLDQSNLEIIRNKNTQQALLKELSLLNQEIGKTKADQAQAGNNFAEIELEEAKARQRVTELQLIITDLQDIIEQTNNQMTEEKIKRASLLQEINHLELELSKQRNNCQIKADEMANKEQELNNIKAKIEKLKLICNDDERMLVVKIKEKKKQEAVVEDIHNHNRYFEEKMREQEEENRLIMKKLTEEREQAHQLELKLARAESEKTGYLERLAESFSYIFTEDQPVPVSEYSKRETQEKIKEFKKQLEEMGEVNLGAIDEFARLAERHSFLTSQYGDLEKGRSSLNRVIKEMEVIMEEKFGQAFVMLSQQFTIVFRELFGGGNAELVLTDEENLLETGIDIIAQPPGKKPQHLSLLSGGERALTAIALLFAILKVKPSPFCVLDEIEASLDEANVYRFAGFLRNITEKTQFVVISHRKGTMEIANILYGVTMEESGVSKLISVKIAEVAS